jgi:hypothetical protein
MIIKEEVVKVEISSEELSRIVMPNLYSAGFRIDDVEHAEVGLVVGEGGEIKRVDGVVLRYKRVKQ